MSIDLSYAALRLVAAALAIGAGMGFGLSVVALLASQGKLQIELVVALAGIQTGRLAGGANCR